MHSIAQQAKGRRTASGHGTFRPDIEGLRGIAVLLVVLYHVGLPGTGGGFTGVDVFFVLSGYLITDLLVAEHARTGRISYVQFYARRVRRLLPAAVLVLTVTLLAGLLVFSPLEQVQYARSALATAAYASNLYFLQGATDYFAADTTIDPFLHTWSLAVEEQFYLVWPMLLALGLGAHGSRGRLRKLMWGVCVVTFVACVWLTVKYRPIAFFGSPFRAWEFGLGGLATLIPAATLTARGAWCRTLGWVGLAGIVGSGMLLSGDALFPAPAALLPVVATVMALVAGVGAPGRGAGVVLGSWPLQQLGKLSYSWYLWHWPVLAFIAAVNPEASVTARAVGAAGALLAAAAAYTLVENPIRFHRALVPRPVLSLGLAGALSVGAIAVAVGGWTYARSAGSTPRQLAIAAAVEDESALHRHRCIVGFMNQGVKECVFGDSTSNLSVVLFGDSHAAQWFPALEPLAQERGWRLVTLVKAGCPPADVPVYNPKFGRQADECGTWRKEAMSRILAEGPDLVVAASSQGYVIRPGRTDGYSRLTPEEWEAGSRRTFATLDSAGIRTVVLRDSPRPTVHVPTCLSRADYRGQDERRCTSDRNVALDGVVFAIEGQAMSGLAQIAQLDLSDLFCEPEWCHPVKDGHVVYRDHSHMTASFVATLAQPVGRRLSHYLPPPPVAD